ncbi:hypothetical protein PGT21_009437 [Puccinia graminis f. sp. tritici]|uniref:Uncharacterized protein n=1 Tax=Puccinia graminis f. sp. tritici TaxID=56615 RepID=A0A5B0QW08_PUCGR|nr:hypothetical protein PGT21_009437 [Puccinia graminis f. sp. tritici]
MWYVKASQYHPCQVSKARDGQRISVAVIRYPLAGIPWLHWIPARGCGCPVSPKIQADIRVSLPGHIQAVGCGLRYAAHSPAAPLGCRHILYEWDADTPTSHFTGLLYRQLTEDKDEVDRPPLRHQLPLQFPPRTARSQAC